MIYKFISIFNILIKSTKLSLDIVFLKSNIIDCSCPLFKYAPDDVVLVGFNHETLQPVDFQ